MKFLIHIIFYGSAIILFQNCGNFTGTEISQLDSASGDNNSSGDSAGNGPESNPTSYDIPALNIELKAAPDLQGFGTSTAAGRGGRVIVISNLNDSGPGSAREALEANGPRQVISNVAGRIILNSPINVRSDASFYGQVAPGEGLTFVRNNGPNAAAIIVSNQENVLIQYMKVRGYINGDIRNLLVMNSRNVVVDHSSFSWSQDQNLNSWEVNQDLTYSNNLSYEGLVPGHDYPTLFGSRGSRGLSVHHNAFVHGSGRMPRVSNFQNYSVDWNVIYNPGNWAIEIATQTTDGGTPVAIHGNITNNWFRRNPDRGVICGEICLRGSGSTVNAYVDGNYLVNTNQFVGAFLPASSQFNILSSPAANIPIITSGGTVQDLPNRLLSHIGAALPVRDANDQRVIRDIIDGTGSTKSDLRGSESPQSVSVVDPPVANRNDKIDLSTVDKVPAQWKTRHGLEASDDLTKYIRFSFCSYSLIFSIVLQQ